MRIESTAPEIIFTPHTIRIAGHGSFITNNSGNYDWRSPQNNNLWKGMNGVNNPCRVRYRIPTSAEWEAERQSWGSNNAAGAYNSPLKLPLAGSRLDSNGSLNNVGSNGTYWSSSVNDILARLLSFGRQNAVVSGGNLRAYGNSVRCLKY